MKRATVYLDEDLHKALKLKAIETESSLLTSSIRLFDIRLRRI